MAGVKGICSSSPTSATDSGRRIPASRCRSTHVVFDRFARNGRKRPRLAPCRGKRVGSPRLRTSPRDPRKSLINMPVGPTVFGFAIHAIFLPLPHRRRTSACIQALHSACAAHQSVRSPPYPHVAILHFFFFFGFNSFSVLFFSPRPAPVRQSAATRASIHSARQNRTHIPTENAGGYRSEKPEENKRGKSVPSRVVLPSGRPRLRRRARERSSSETVDGFFPSFGRFR